MFEVSSGDHGKTQNDEYENFVKANMESAVEHITTD